MSAPQWADSGQGDLLELVALGSPSTGTADAEWDSFVAALKRASLYEFGGVIRPNVLRPMVRDEVAPRRVGAFTSRAVARGLIEPTGDFEVSDDTRGRNAGRPARCYRWIGGAR